MTCRMPGDSVSLGFVSANSALTLEAPLPGGWQTCHACDATYRNRELSRGEKLYCSRCGALLAAPRIGSARQHALALGLTGLVCLILANIFPIMTFDVLGAKASNHLITGVLGLFAQDYSPLAALVFFSAILAPALYLLLCLYTLSARCLDRNWPWDYQAYRVVELLAPWNLVPVFLVACLVAVVRLDLLGTVTWHRGVVFVILLSVCCLLLEQIRESAGQESDSRLRPRFDPRVKRQRAVALIVSGAILYPFANLLPVMTMTVPGDRAALTVWGAGTFSRGTLAGRCGCLSGQHVCSLPQDCGSRLVALDGWKTRLPAWTHQIVPRGRNGRDVVDGRYLFAFRAGGGRSTRDFGQRDRGTRSALFCGSLGLYDLCRGQLQ